MSGGSMDYLYSRVQDAAFRENTALRRAFRRHLDLVSKALHDIEWVDSADYGPGDEEESIRAVIGAHGELAQLIADATAARDALNAALERKA